MKSFEAPRMSIRVFEREGILTLSDKTSRAAAEEALANKGVSVKINFAKSGS